MLELESITKVIGAVSATIALVGGGYTLSNKFGMFEKDILVWSPNHFRVTGGPVDEGFKVLVARQKLRDDCEVIGFRVEMRDSDYFVHRLTPSVAQFSGPAGTDVDRFGFMAYLPELSIPQVSLGEATLQAQIKYNCPEGEKIVSYPNHDNLTFTVEKKDTE
mgnify:CR=1 FL=1